MQQNFKVIIKLLFFKTILSEDSDLEYFIHYWFGSKSTTDETNIVAIKAFELDEFLNEKSIQFREVLRFFKFSS